MKIPKDGYKATQQIAHIIGTSASGGQEAWLTKQKH